MTEANEPQQVHGRVIIDPSENVSDLVESAVTRLDDLRKAEQKSTRRAHKSVRREVRLQAKSIRREAKLRSNYEEKLSFAESQRLDSIRGVDVAASAADRVVQETRATTLATAQNASAEALRGQVATTAAAQTIALDNKIAPVQKDISDLREVQYKQQGERAQAIESRVDNRESIEMLKPIYDILADLMRAQQKAVGQQAQLTENRAKNTNWGMWAGIGVAVITIMASSFFQTLLIGATVYFATKKP
jgi:hypothetical protein